jgi:hypothetical protein
LIIDLLCIMVKLTKVWNNVYINKKYTNIV